jgi:zinc transport system substrate-binding protein
MRTNWLFQMFMRGLLGLQIGFATLSPAWASGHPPNVVASIKPVHALVQTVMKGVGTSRLLIADPAAAHHAALRPSQARQLQDADILFWVGPVMERALIDAVPALTPDSNAVRLIELDGLTLHRAGRGAHGHDGHTEPDHAEPDHARPGADGHQHDDDGVNPHIWLDPDNLKLMLSAIAEVLGRADTDNAAIYRANAATAAKRIDAVLERVASEMAPLPKTGFAVLHDAHVYFERQFGFHADAILTVEPDVPPRARQLWAVRQLVVDGQVSCIFSEVGAPSKAVDMIVDGHDITVVRLDPLGTMIAEGADFFPQLLGAYAAGFTRCLGRPDNG